MFILNNFYCDRQIIVDNQYYRYYYVCFKLCLSVYFLSNYYNVMLVTINMTKVYTKIIFYP